jgi:uncharacterized protein YbaP (TraB family)
MIKYALIFALTLGSFSVSAQLVDENHQLLWEISGNGLKKKSYLYGNYHTNDRRVFNLADSVYYALNNADAISLEVDAFSDFDDDFHWDTRYGNIRFKYDKNGVPYTNSNTSTETRYGDEDGMPQFLDAWFHQYCLNAGKEFFPLETIEFQESIGSSRSYSSPDYWRWARSLISREDLLNIYLKGDIYELDKFMRSTLGGGNGFYKELITDRNRGMAHMMDSLLQQDDRSLFTAVGAGHLASSTGLINLLRNKGYTLRKVMATYSDDVTIDKLEVKSKRSYLYENDSIGVQIEFPGKPTEFLNEDGWEDYAFRLIYRELGQGNNYVVEFYERNDESSFEELADTYIASPSESPYEKVELDNGGEAFQGLSDAYPEGLYWTRVVLGEDYILVLKAYGGNKFMNSKRAMRFFDRVNLN